MLKEKRVLMKYSMGRKNIWVWLLLATLTDRVVSRRVECQLGEWKVGSNAT